MKAGIPLITLLALGLCTAAPGWAQSSTDQNTTTNQKTAKTGKQHPGAGRDVANGSGDIGKGAAKGAGNLAKGAGQGAGDLVTLHPVDAAAAAGKGAGTAGKDVAVGTTKGTGKIARGIGKAFKKLF